MIFGLFWGNSIMRLYILTSNFLFMYSLFYFLDSMWDLLLKRGKESTMEVLIMWSLPLVLETTTGDLFEPTAIRNKPFLSGHVSKVTHLKPSEVPLLWDGDHLAARELELGLRRASTTHPYSTPWCRWTGWPGQCEPWPVWTVATVPCGFPKAPCIPVWSLHWGQHWDQRLE